MKKFLTVLLALSVVFTYTVGTAFAAQTTDEKAAAVTRDLTLATQVLNSHAESFQVTEKLAGNYTDTAIEYAVKAAKDLGLLFINNYSAEKAAANGDYADNPVTIELQKWINGATTVAAGTGAYAFTKASYQAAYDSFVNAKDCEAAKAEALAKLAAIDTSKYYVDADKNIDGVTAAKELIAKATAAIKAVKEKSNQITKIYDDKTNVGGPTADYKLAIGAYLYGVNSAGAVAGTATAPLKGTGDIQGLYTRLALIQTIAQHDKETATNKESVSFAMSELTTYGKVTFYKKNRVAAADNGKTDVTGAYGFQATTGTAGTLNGVAIANKTTATDAEVTAANAALLTRVQNTLNVLEVYFTEDTSKIGEVVSTVGGLLTDSGFKTAITNAERAIGEYDVIAKAGTAKKLELNQTTGMKKYDDAEIDKILANAKTEIYAGYKATVDMSKVWDTLSDVSSSLAKAIADAQAKFDSTEKADAKYKAAFYDSDVEVQNAVKATLKKAKEDLAAAKSIEEVNKIMSALDADLAKVRTAENQAAVVKAIADANYETFLNTYANAQYALKGSDYRAGSFTGAGSALEAAKKLVNSAMTVSELPGLFEQAKALFNNVKTDAELKAAGQALAAKIGALKATVTLADRDALLAVKADVKAFKEMYGASDADVYNLALFNAKLTTLKTVEQNSIVDQIKALPATDKLTAADAGKVKAIRAELEKYLAEYEVASYGYNGADTSFAVSNYKVLTDAEEKLEGLDLEAVQKLIFALPTTVTIKDAEAIKAARKAYDALTAAQQATLIKNGYYAKLIKVENDLKVLESAQNAKIVAGVKNTTLTAKSTAAKGSITITWAKSAGYKVDGYEVFKSTKRYSGFGTKAYFTTTKTSYKNTKGLKAGKTYYYKVRGFRVVDDVKVYTKWSTKAIRTAR